MGIQLLRTVYYLLSAAYCLRPTVGCLLLGLLAVPAMAATPWYQDFEGPTTSWKHVGGNVRGTIERHERIDREAYVGSRCEWLRVTGQGGTRIYISHEVGRPKIIPELRASLWVKSNRPGIQIFARVVLPRTEDPRKDPQSRTPIMLRLEGTSYTQVGRWQQLHLENLKDKLIRRVRGLRLRMNSNVDGREAYVDQILLNVYGGPGTTDVWIDELNLTGYVNSTSNIVPLSSLPNPSQSTAPSTTIVPNGNTTRSMSADVHAAVSRDYQKAASRPRSELVGFELRVDGQPMMPRAIVYQGESLGRLKKLGFNTIWLSRPAWPTILSEAARLGLKLVCPPPEYVTAPSSNDPTAPEPRIGPEYDPVIAWDLGAKLSGDQVEPVRALARRLRAADGHCRRPLVCRPDSNLWGYSGFVDVFVIGQSPLATSLELFDYGRWIHHRARLARLDTAIWSTVQTQPSEALMQQWASAGQRESLPPETTVEQIRLLAYTAIAAGSRGLLFESTSSLESTDAATRARAAAIELVNLELDVARPWVTAGKLLGTIDGSEVDTSAAVFQYPHTRLLVPLWSGRGAQYVPGQAAQNQLKFIVPGVPEANHAYVIGPGSMQRIKPFRTTGGTEVTLNEFSLCSMVFFAEKPKIVNHMLQEAQRIGPRASQLYRKLASRKLEIAEDVDRRMSSHAAAQWQGREKLTLARKYLQSCDGALARKDHATACLEAERAMRMLRIVERSNWEKAVVALRSPITSPATVCFSTLPWHWSLTEQTRSWSLGPNQVGGGDFESVAASTAAGWRHLQHAVSGIKAEGEVVAKAKHSGAAGLRLAVTPADADNAPALVETPPIWVESPPVYLEAGTLVRIQGWVHLPTPLTGSVDGLMVFDSITGEALAERIGETTGWQPFALYRFVPQSGPMSVTFALCGLGEAWIDDVVIQVVRPTDAPMGQRPTAPARRF